MSVKLVIPPREKDLAGFSIRRVLPFAKQRMVGPWIFFDHMGPAFFPAGKGIDVPPHPHINLATVTYLFEGEILHRDSVGNVQAIRPGDINLMVAGRGITHSERERDEIRAQDHSLHGLQLWHALPEEYEEIDPAFYHYSAADIPKFDVGNVAVRLMMGQAYGYDSPVKTFADTLYVEADLNAGDQLELPQTEELAVYAAAGSFTIKRQEIETYQMAVLSDHAAVKLVAKEDTRIAMIGGAKMSKRFIDWNFVSSRPERLEQAKSDWREGRFPKVIDEGDAFMPLPE